MKNTSMSVSTINIAIGASLPPGGEIVAAADARAHAV
jgi:hypothetical protein